MCLSVCMSSEGYGKPSLIICDKCKILMSSPIHNHNITFKIILKGPEIVKHHYCACHKGRHNRIRSYHKAN